MVRRLGVAAVSMVGALVLAFPQGAHASPARESSIIDPQIIGGVEATIQDAPWQVALLRSDEPNPFLAQSCGGSIISPEWIVTAAHCVDRLGSPGELQVAAGVTTLPNTAPSDVVRYGVSRVIINPQWNSDTYYADVALLRLSEPLPLNGSTMAAISLPTFSGWPQRGSVGLITGWGNAQSQQDPRFPTALRKASVTVLSDPSSPACGEYPEAPAPGGYDAAAMLCAGTASAPYIDACQGDSGGPLAIQRDGQWFLAGITSWGRGCAEPGYPGIYTRVTSYVDWIRSAQAPGATGSITVTASGSSDLLCTYVYNAQGDAGPIATRCGGSASSITVPDLMPGQYLVKNVFEGIYDADTWHSASGPTLQRSSASTVTVTASREARVTNSTVAATVMSFSLPSAAASLGRNLCVDVYSISEALWTYDCLDRGSTSLRVVAIPPSPDGFVIYVSDASATYASYYYTGAGQPGSLAYDRALAVSSPVNTTTSVSLTLTRAARISGTVSLGEGGDPGGLVTLSEVGVADPVLSVDVDASGSYSLIGLPPGNYEVGASDPRGLHKPQWWNGASSRETSTAISLSAGASVTGISMRLTAAGVISGRVTGPRGAALSADADISAILYRDEVRVGNVDIESDGLYAFVALDPGQYRIDFVDEGGVYYSEFYGGSPDLAGATPVSVSAGQTTSGIDMALSFIERIEITASRTGKGAKSQIVVKGSTTGLAGSRVTPWIKLAGAKRFVAGKPVTVRANGTFTWTYRTPKAASVYVTSGSVRSQTVGVRAASR